MNTYLVERALEPLRRLGPAMVTGSLMRLVLLDFAGAVAAEQTDEDPTVTDNTDYSEAAVLEAATSTEGGRVEAAVDEPDEPDETAARAEAVASTRAMAKRP